MYTSASCSRSCCMTWASVLTARAMLMEKDRSSTIVCRESSSASRVRIAISESGDSPRRCLPLDAFLISSMSSLRSSIMTRAESVSSSEMSIGGRDFSSSVSCHGVTVGFRPRASDRTRALEMVEIAPRYSPRLPTYIPWFPSPRRLLRLCPTDASPISA